MQIKKSSVERYYTYTTSKGLKVSLIKRESSPVFHMAMLINFGGMDTNFLRLYNNEFITIPKGVAHFLEHKMFESKNGDTFERFSKQSANINAYTNSTSTVYYFSCTDKKEENIKLFLECLSNPYITSGNVEKEKGIIAQEINMYKDNPSSKIYSNLLNGMYYKNPIKYDVAGDIKDIEGIDYDTLMTCYDTFYSSKSMEIFVVGEIDPEELFSIIEKNEAFQSGEKALKIYPSETLKIKKEKIKEEMDVFDTNFLIGFKLDTREYKGREILKREIIYSMILEHLCGDMSPLYERLYKDSYIDSSFGYGVNIHNKYGFNLLGGVSKSPEKVLDEFYKDVYKLIGEGIEEKDFDIMKKMMIGSYTRIFDDSFALMNNLISSRNKGGCFLEIISIIKSITESDINNSIKEVFGKERTILSIINPISKKE